MADDVIKEFLVGLGFKTDEKQLKTFTAGIDTATKAVTKLVTTIVGASLTVAAGVSAFASNLEGLYFASQRIGASAESIRATEHAARDFGASAEEARGAMEGIASFIRSTPGAESYLKGLGVQTRDISGNLRDTGDVMVDLGQRFKGMDYWLAKQYASSVGISESMLRAMMQDDFGKKFEENKKRLARSGMGQATKDAHQFMIALRDVGLEFEVFSVQVQAALMRKLGPNLKDFSRWFQENGPRVADRVAEITVKLIELAEDAGPYLEKLWDFFVDLDESTNGWSTKIIALLVLLRALGAAPLVSGILKLAGAFVKLGVGIAGLSGAAAILTPIAGAAAMLYSSSLNVGEDEIVKKIREKQGLPPVEEQTPQQKANETAAVDAWKKLQGVDKDTSNQLLDFFESMGWTKEQSAGIVANLAAESSSFNPKAMGDWGKARGIAQWHRDRQDAFEKWAGFSIRDDRADLIKQAEFVHYELTEGAEHRAGALLRATQNAGAAGRVVSEYYERPKKREEEAAVRGAMASQLVNNTTINVNGAGDPAAVGRSVANEQTRVGAEVARNMNTPEVY